MIPVRSRGPVVLTLSNSAGDRGINCCCCRCCTCMQLNVLKTEPGVMKLAEIMFQDLEIIVNGLTAIWTFVLSVILGFFCQSLALKYGTEHASTMGISFQSFVTTSSWCLLTSLLLLFCYVFSQKSFSLLKSSMFETVFNGVAAFSYVTTCSCLGYVLNVFLQPTQLLSSFLYSAMSTAYMLGTLLGVIYGYDAYKSYKYFKGYR